MRQLGWLTFVVFLAGQLHADFDIPEIFGIEYYISNDEIPDGNEKGDVYRPAGYNFLHPFPLLGFKFDTNYQYTSYEQVSADAPLTVSTGTWRQEGGKIRVYQNGEQEKIKFKGTIQRIIKLQDCGCGGNSAGSESCQ